MLIKVYFYQKHFQKSKSIFLFPKTCKSDICRTYDDPKFSNIEFQQKMERILVAIAFMYPEMGYCQGMSFVIGEILNVVHEEELTFWLFIGLIQKFFIQLVYMNGLPAAHLHMYLLGGLLEMYIPELDIHLRKLGVSWDLFTAKFIFTLGSGYIPLGLLAQIFDIFFMEGWAGLYKICISFLMFYKEKICGMDLTQLSEYLKNIRKIITESDLKKILVKTTQLHIQKDSIEKSIDSFFKTQAEKYLTNQPNTLDWPLKFKGLLQFASEKIQNLIKQHELDSEYYSQKLQNIEKSLIEYFFIPNYLDKKRAQKSRYKKSRICRFPH